MKPGLERDIRTSRRSPGKMSLQDPQLDQRRCSSRSLEAGPLELSPLREEVSYQQADPATVLRVVELEG